MLVMYNPNGTEGRECLEKLGGAYASTPELRKRFHNNGLNTFPDFPTFQTFWDLVDVRSKHMTTGEAVYQVIHGCLWRSAEK